MVEHYSTALRKFYEMSSSHGNPSWEILTCIRYDPQLLDNDDGYYILPYHQARILAAADDFGWEEGHKLLKGAGGLAHLKTALDSHIKSGVSSNPSEGKKCYKVRVLLSSDGRLAISSDEVQAVPKDYLFPSSLQPPTSGPVDLGIPLTWRIYISPIRTVPSPHTKHKTTHRPMYNEARKHIPSSDGTLYPGLNAEILMVNQNDEIMEGSITTPYFQRSGLWVTPSSSCGGNLGTTRRWALEKGLSIERTVMRADVKVGELVWLSNGVKGWGLGTVHNL